MARLIYALLTTFVNNKNFNIMYVKVLYTVVLSALPEFVVAFVFLLTGVHHSKQAIYQQRSLLIRQRNDDHQWNRVSEEQHPLYYYQYIPIKR
ncbi:uncharacterized protein Z519_07916 [Cladophialophora bantiana CBS 173.52]|uniref:DUF7702 domain-containing protein n=1 Tax=Cladophialophora bantiana (strain ATCC 10958 / CBS 173.52 / CDC B-1940 / NIH 8579) TaxID=1442370 RepID=A0A0D2FX20_CLAB1|nr:uncharacterized protein Z519_07916 [Cladophialophora bantiana CBS 173.52]KIW91022.1 hypothetical protein Z519_07916 [Cladophialophora bantiana CBS 173.52]